MILFLLIFLTAGYSYAEYQVNYNVLQGVWSYFHITPDYFAMDKLVGVEQRLAFQDKERVTLTVVAQEEDYNQDTVYELRYSLSLRDNVPYLSLFSTESTHVMGAYIRMPYQTSIELAADPNFTKERQLYQKKDSDFIPLLAPARASTNTNITTNYYINHDYIYLD